MFIKHWRCCMDLFQLILGQDPAGWHVLKNLRIHSTWGHSLSCFLWSHREESCVCVAVETWWKALGPPSPLLSSRILFKKKNTVSLLVEKKVAVFQTIAGGYNSFVYYDKARQGRRSLVPSPLNSLFCVKQQQQYKQTSQKRLDENSRTPPFCICGVKTLFEIPVTILYFDYT